MTTKDALGVLIQVADAAIIKGSFLSREEVVIIDRAIKMLSDTPESILADEITPKK